MICKKLSPVHSVFMEGESTSSDFSFIFVTASAELKIQGRLIPITCDAGYKL